MKTRAFTLVEIMILVAIIGLLAALFLPRIIENKTKKLAEKAHTCKIKEVSVSDMDMVVITFAGGTITTNILGQMVNYSIKEDTFTCTWGEIEEAQKWLQQRYPTLENVLPAKTRP